MGLAISRGLNKRPRRCLFYGVPGIGKTTSAVTESLLLDLERGSGDIDCARIDAAPKSLDEFKEILKALIADGFDEPTLTIDTIDVVESFIKAEVAKKENVACIDAIEYGKGPGMMVPYWESLIAGFETLAKKHGKNLVLIGHCAVTKMSPPGSETFQRYEPDMLNASSKTLRNWCDEVLFYRYRNAVTIEEQGFGKERAIAIDKAVRYIQTAETLAAVAKNRVGLPMEIESFDEYRKHLYNPAK